MNSDTEGVLNIKNSDFKNNSALVEGGILYWESDQKPDLQKSNTFKNNKAVSYGDIVATKP